MCFPLKNGDFEILAKPLKSLAPLSRETSNSLFEVFEEWHDHLKHVDFEEIDKQHQETLNDGEDE